MVSNSIVSIWKIFINTSQDIRVKTETIIKESLAAVDGPQQYSYIEVLTTSNLECNCIRKQSL